MSEEEEEASSNDNLVQRFLTAGAYRPAACTGFHIYAALGSRKFFFVYD
jgi:hypothetical protein